MRSFVPQSRQPAIETPCIVAELLDDIDSRLSGKQGMTDANIHRIRKDCKRLRALLRLVQPALGKRVYRGTDHKVRDYAALLAHARDRTVLIDTLDRLADHYGSLLSSDALPPVRMILEEDTANANRDNKSVPEVAVMEQGLSELRDCFSRLDYSGISQDTLLDGLLASYRRGRKALAGLEAQPDDEQAHVLRRHTKYLYNQFSFLAGWNSSELAPVVEDFHSVEDALGLVHDLSVLIATLKDSAPLRSEALRRELVISLAESRWVSQLSVCLRLARKLYKRKPGRQHNWLSRQLGVR